MITDAASPIFQWLNANPEFAGLATFLISAGESIAVIGTIVPGSVMMTLIGALIGAGIIPLWSTLIWAILGAILGDGISYWLGHYFKDRIHTIWPFRNYPQFLINGERFFYKYGGMSVFIGRFVGPVRALVPLVAGMLGMKPFRFTVANVTSAFLWAPMYMLPGFLLGAASLEVPSEVGTRLILVVLFIVLFIVLCIWLLKKIFVLINIEFNQILDWLWRILKGSKYSYFFTNLLKHHDKNRTHGQLGLAFCFIILTVFFLLLALDLAIRGPQIYILNNLFFHIFRGLRTPNTDNVMIYITLLGDKSVLIPIILTLFIWLGWNKRWYAAWHVFALGLLTIASIKFFKYLIQVPRPWGVIGNNVPYNYSFPSGHTTLAIVFYLGITVFIVKMAKPKRTRLIYILISLLIAAIAISRLYFGVHWFTDILGGLLLGAALLILISLSYNRRVEKNAGAKGVFVIFITTLLLTYVVNVTHSFYSLKSKYTQIDWPSFTISFDAWWQQKNDLPIFRINRYGLKSSLFNVQWLGDLNQIRETLFQNGWKTPPTGDWVRIFYRIASVQSTQHLPLIAPLYLDKRPALVLIKHIDKRLIIIRLWDSHFFINTFEHPLWIGSLEYAPSTYSWLFKSKHKMNDVVIDPKILFNKPPVDYDIYETEIKVSFDQQWVIKKMLLIKPKSLHFSHLSYGLSWLDDEDVRKTALIQNYWS